MLQLQARVLISYITELFYRKFCRFNLSKLFYIILYENQMSIEKLSHVDKDRLIVNIASWINTKSNIIWLFCLKIFVGFYGFLSERLFYPTRTPNYTVQWKCILRRCCICFSYMCLLCTRFIQNCHNCTLYIKLVINIFSTQVWRNLSSKTS